MNLRKLIREEVARSIPFEHKLTILRDTQHRSRYHLGGRSISAREMGLEDRPLNLRPVSDLTSRAQDEGISKRQKTEREKDYDRFMEDKRFGAGGPLQRALVEPAPRLDILMCGSVMKEVKVNKIFKDLNDNFVIHVDTAGDPANPLLKPWDIGKATPTQSRMLEALKKVNETFGTMYFIDVSYLREAEEVFVVKSGKRELASKKPVTYGQYLDFREIVEQQQRILRAMEAVHGLGHLTSDNTPWRSITEPLNVKPARAAIIGTSARNG